MAEGSAEGDGLHRVAMEVLSTPIAILAGVRGASGAIVDFDVAYANPALFALLGPTLASAPRTTREHGPIGSRVLDLWPILRRGDALRQVVTVVETGEPWAFRLRTAGYGLAPGWIEGVANRLGDGALISLRDINATQQHRLDLDEAQVAYRTLVEALPDRVVCVFDTDLRIRLIAGPGLSRTGLAPDEIIGRRVSDLMSAGHRTMLEDRARAALAGTHVVVPQVTFGSSTIWRIDMAPLAGGDGVTRSGMIVALDVTEEVKSRQERDRMLWELQQAQRVARTGSWSWDAGTGEMWLSAELRRQVELPSAAPGAGLDEGLARLARRSQDGARLRQAWQQALADRQPFELDLQRRLGDGAVRHLVLRAEVVVGEGGEVTGLRGTTQDVTDVHRARQALAESEERFRLAFDESPIGKALLSPSPRGEGRVLRVNRTLSRLLGRPAAELIGTSLWDAVHPDDRDATRAAVSGDPRGPQLPRSRRVEVRLAVEGGRAVWAGVGATAVRDADGRPMYLLAQIEDVTARREAESQLIRQARFDPLTGLPNRVSLIEHLERQLADGGPAAVFFLDLDDFKTVNDSLGHVAGDELIERVAAQLERCVRGDGYAARWGGDEFVVVSASQTRSDQARALADRIRLAVCERVSVDGHEVTATVSIGVAFGEQGSTADGLLRDADIAMYRAKAAGKDRWALADSAGHVGAMRRLTLGAALRHALAEEQLCLRYQPIVDLADGRVTSVEALLRWRHPQRGMLEPADFLDVAESSALIVPVGEWALRTAAFQAMRWYRRFGERAPTVAVNVSARQLGHDLLYDRVVAALADSGLPASRLCVELTEREAVAASGSAALDLRAVHQAGVQLAIDDFGTGYAGLDYLRRFAVDILKIDQSFVRGLGTDPTDTAIIVSLVTLGRALDVTVVAEGVEDEHQRAMLHRLRCPQGQGRLWSEPVDAEQIDELLASGALKVTPAR